LAQKSDRTMSDMIPGTKFVGNYVNSDDDDDDDDDDLPIIEVESIQQLKLPESLLADVTYQQLTARLARVGTNNEVTSSNIPTCLPFQKSRHERGILSYSSNQSIESTPISATLEGNNSIIVLDNESEDDNIINNKTKAQELKMHTFLPLDKHTNVTTRSFVGSVDNSLFMTPSKPSSIERQREVKKIASDSILIQKLQIVEDKLFRKYLKRIQISEQNEANNRKIVIEKENNNKQRECNDAITSINDDQGIEENEMFERYVKRIRLAERPEKRKLYKESKAIRKEEERIQKRSEKNKRIKENKILRKDEEDMFQRYTEQISIAEKRERNESNDTKKINTNVTDVDFTCNEYVEDEDVLFTRYEDVIVSAEQCIQKEQNNSNVADVDFTWHEYVEDEDVLFTRYEDVIVSAEKCIQKEQKLIDKMKEALQVRKDRRARFVVSEDTATKTSKKRDANI
jgi:hypothetical protein